ncbi:MAG: sulfite exporter TauE/SafE family protein [Calditrichaeota bacterium]|nr:sulfite exporter TauE/SafE family protein [Calditrichota bacterium]MCB9391490.1 sulfite exporter TauE/SafE family protein [Calditrichota bacterium]
MFRLASIALLLGFLSHSSPLMAQEGDGPVSPGVPVRAVWSTDAIAADGTSELGLVFNVPAKHHITDVEFGLFYVTVTDTLGLLFGEPQFPKGEPFHDEVCYRGEVLVRVPVTATPDALLGIQSIPIEAGYQICQEYGQEVCFLPEDKQLTTRIEIRSAGSQVIAANERIFAGSMSTTEAEEPKGLEARLMAALEGGSWTAFLVAFLGGILASFTPCVYPVIPITIGYIGGSSAGKPLRGLLLSTIFALGIAVVYSTLGLFAAATGTLFGSISGSPVVNIVIALVFGVMGISMLGAFDIALPAALQSSLTGGSAKRGFFGPLLLGMASGLVMAPCVGPVIVALLAWVARTGDLFYGWALLFTFSLGLGLLFLVIGTFAGAIQALPRAGSWMEVVKKGFGWILLAGALYMLRLTLPQPIYFAAWSVLLITFSVFSGAFDTLTDEATPKQRIGKALTLIIFLMGGIFLFKSFYPNAVGATASVASAHSELEWMVNKEEQAIELSASSGKPVLIDVYADWCVACVELDEKTWVVPSVQKRVDEFVRLKLDFTKETPWVKEMKQKYKITGMPTVILQEGEREVTRFTGFKPAEEFIALLDRHNL